MGVYACARVYTYTYVCVYDVLRIYVYMYVFVCALTCIHVRVHMPVYKHVCPSVHMRTDVSVCICICMQWYFYEQTLCNKSITSIKKEAYETKYILISKVSKMFVDIFHIFVPAAFPNCVPQNKCMH